MSWFRRVGSGTLQGGHARVTLEDRDHQGLSVLEDGTTFRIEAWAENWDDLWSWEAEISDQEFERAKGDRTFARTLLADEREWLVTPPSSVPKEPYRMTGRLGGTDGFMDGGTGSRGW